VRMGFGKYSTREVEWVVENDPSYVRWLLSRRAGPQSVRDELTRLTGRALTRGFSSSPLPPSPSPHLSSPSSHLPSFGGPPSPPRPPKRNGGGAWGWAVAVVAVIVWLAWSTSGTANSKSISSGTDAYRPLVATATPSSYTPPPTVVSGGSSSPASTATNAPDTKFQLLATPLSMSVGNTGGTGVAARSECSDSAQVPAQASPMAHR